MSEQLRVIDEISWQYYGKAQGISAILGGGCVPVALTDIELNLPKFCGRCRSPMVWRGDLNLTINEEAFDPKNGQAFEVQMLACKRSYYGPFGKRPCAWTTYLRRRHALDMKLPSVPNMFRRSINENPGAVFTFLAVSLVNLLSILCRTYVK